MNINEAMQVVVTACDKVMCDGPTRRTIDAALKTIDNELNKLNTQAIEGDKPD